MQPSETVDGMAIQKAIEGRDGHALADFYADDAVLRIIDKHNPPSNPRELTGKVQIAEFWNDVCGREMQHKVEALVSEGSRISLTETCAYPDGTHVFCAAMIDIAGGKIARQTMIQACDE